MHVGFDTEQNPTFQTKKNNPGGRRVIRPEDLGARIDGRGRNLPFVKIATQFRNLRDLATITEDDLKKIDGIVAITIRGIDMAKMKKHATAQADAVLGKQLDKIMRAIPGKTAKAIAAYAPKTTARASLKAMGYSEEQIKTILAMKPEKA